MLCTTCIQIFENPNPTSKREHQLTLQTLGEAASKSCAICTVLWGIICRNKWPLQSSPTAALQPVSEYWIRTQSERMLSLDFTVNANGVGTAGVRGDMGIASEFLVRRVGGMNISYILEKQVERDINAAK